MAFVEGYDLEVYENATLPDEERVALISAISSMQADERGGWLDAVQPSILPEHVRRLDNETVRIELKTKPHYSIDSPETLTLVIPPELVTSRQLVTAIFGSATDAAGLRIAPAVGNVSVHGSFTSHATRADVRSIDEYTLSLTLDGGERWRPNVGLSDVECMFAGADQCASALLLRGLTSSGREAGGWEAVLLGGLTYLDVERRDDVTVDIAISSRYASYFVTSPETLSVNIPAEALKSDAPLSLASAITIGVNSTNGRATLGGVFLQRENLVETAVQLEELTLEVNLVDDSWTPSFSSEVIQAIVHGIAADARTAHGWESVLQPALTAANVTRVNDTVLAITFQHESYDLQFGVPELLSITVPPIAVASAVAQPLSPSIRVDPVVCTVSLGGDLASHPAHLPFLLHEPRGTRESALRDVNGTYLVVRLHGCTWVRTPAGKLADERRLLDGITSAQSEPRGFAAVLMTTLLGGDPLANDTSASLANASNTSYVSMINASALVVRVPRLGIYDISAPETITVAVSKYLVAFNSTPANSPTFEIAVVPGLANLVIDSVRLSPLRSSTELDEASVQLMQTRVILILTDETWATDIGSDCHQGSAASSTMRLLSAFVSSQSEPHGFNSEVHPQLSCEHVFRNSSSTLTIVLPPTPGFDITVAETIALVVPAEAVRSGQTIAAQPPLVIEVSTPRVVLGGSLLTPVGLTEASLSAAAELQLVISLIGVTWLEQSAWRNSTNQLRLLDGIRSLDPHLAAGWEAAVRPMLFPEDVHFVDGTTLTVRVPQAATYFILQAETIGLTVDPDVTRTLLSPLPASPLLVVKADGGSIAFNGSLLSSLSEASLGPRGTDMTTSLDVRLLYDEWVDETQLQELVSRGFRAAEPQAEGFNSALQPALTVHRRSSSLISIVTPPSAEYVISRPEALTLTIPPGATRSAQGAQGSFNLVAMPEAGSVVLSDADSPGGLYLYLDKSETHVRSESSIELQLALSDDTFSLDVGEDTNASRLLIEGFTSLQTGANSWNSIVQRTMSYTHLRRIDDTHLIVTIPQAADYDITAPETIVLSLPGEAFASAASPSLVAAGPAARLVINASQGSSALSGSLLADANVASIQSPVENTITISLTDVDFAMALFSTTSMQSALARSLATREGDELSNVEPFGWNAIVRPGLSYDNLQFDAGTRQAVSIRIPQFAAYQISSPETVSVVIPAESLLGGIESLRAEPAFIVEAPRAGGLFGGTLLRNVGEDDLRTTANYTLSVTLSGDEWSPGIGEPCAAGVAECVTTSLLSNLVATSSSTLGWNAIVRGSLPVSAVNLDAATQRLTITFPSYGGYEIESPETITLTLPASATASGNRIFVSPAFRIRAASGAARISGRALGRVTEEDIRQNGAIEFEVTLYNDTFAPLVGHRHVDPYATTLLLRGVRSAQHEESGWNAVVLPVLARKNVMRDSTTHLTVHLPICTTYDISAPETISVAIPPEAVSSGQILRAGAFVVQANAGSVDMLADSVSDTPD